MGSSGKHTLPINLGYVGGSDMLKALHSELRSLLEHIMNAGELEITLSCVACIRQAPFGFNIVVYRFLARAAVNLFPLQGIHWDPVQSL